jgi:hypothetical protein
MRRDYLDSVQLILNKKLGDLLHVNRYETHITLTNDNDDLIAIIHGGVFKPFEIILIHLGAERRLNITYDEFEDLVYFIKNKLRAYMIAVAI